MNIPYVCSRCARRLVRPSCNQLRKASFVSLGSLVDRDDGSKAQVKDEVVTNDEIADVRTFDWRKRKSFAQQYQEQRKPAGVDKVLETLFSSSQRRGGEPQISRYSRSPKKQQVEQGDVENTIDLRLRDLHQQLRQGSSLEDIWISCQQLLGEQDQKVNKEVAGDDGHKRHPLVLRDLLLAICSRRRIVVQDVTVTPATVIKEYMKHGVMGYWWPQVMWALLGQVINSRQLAVDTTVEDQSRAGIHDLSQDMLELWSLFIKRYRFVGDRQVPSSRRRQSSKSNPQLQLVQHFVHLLPKHPFNAWVGSMGAAAILTSETLEAECIQCPVPLGEFFSRLRQVGNPDIETARNALLDAGVTPDLVDATFEKWKPLESDARPRRTSERDSLGKREPSKTLQWNQEALSARLADIDGSFKRADVEDAINLWNNYLHYLNTEKSNDEETKDLITARFLRVFWALRCSERAIEVWNHMVDSGKVPGQIHWTAMLSGCVPARDVKSLQAIWASMSRSKLKPDINCWTTYIHGLIKLHRWEEGLQALESLGRTWKASSAKGTPATASLEHGNDVPAKIIEPVNAALSALVDTQRSALTPTVIAWAESQNLRLETYTFNILLRPLVRTGTPAQIQSHLAQMAEHNCAPDVATFTIILNGLVSNKDSNFHNLPPDTQESTIISILNDMEEKGVPPNTFTYSALLDGLLGGKTIIYSYTDTNTNNIPAARTILAHMQKRRISPSPHIYTILITHYFRCTPPDLAAIDSLWASIGYTGQTAKVDAIFYDRLIEGYADIDEIEKALEFLRQVPLEGKSPGWWALYRVLAALERGGEWDLCRELMHDVEDAKDGLLRHGQGLFRGKRDFYELVDALRAKGVMMGGEAQV